MSSWYQKVNKISFKLILSLLSFFIILFMVSIFYIPSRIENEVTNNEIQKSRVLGSLISSSIAPALYFNDADLIKKEVMNLYQVNNLLFVVINDENDSTIFSYRSELIEKLNYSKINKEEFIADTVLFSVANINFEKEYLGNIHIAYSLSGALAKGKEQSTDFIGIVFFIFLFGLFISITISKLVTKQLNAIIKTAYSVKFGDFSYRVQIFTNDEVGFVAKKFNEMLDNINELYTNLELRVNLRTKELLETNTKLLSEISTRIDAEERIKSSLQEKEVLLKEIHHRVKNNLQVISSLLFLQSRKIEIKEYKEIFNESQNRIKSMALVHENLYKSDNLAGIELQDYMKALLNHLLRTYNVSTSKIKQEISIEKIILSIDKSIPLGLIMNELITNSLKYAFPDSDEGKIVISIKRLESGNIYISFSDNGIGMPVDFDIKKANSLGLKLVETLVDQLEGTFKWVNNNGSEFIIEFNEVLKSRN